MIIEELDSLKLWLSQRLEPICDADPSALAKYVIALVKKDKSVEDLKALCEDQLDVFLGDETKPFVAGLFGTLSSKSYMPVAPPVSITNTENNTPLQSKPDNEQKGKKRKSFEDTEQSEVDKVLKTDNKADVGKIIHENKSDNITKENKNILKSTNIPEKNENFKTDDNDDKINDKFIDKDKPMRSSSRQSANKDENDYKHNLLSDVQMRSMSQDRSVKSMSPAVKSKHSHSSRRKSPRSPTRSSSRHKSSRRDRSRRDHRDRSRERRSTRRRENKEKCRDYEEKGFCMLGEVCPYDHGYDPVEVDDTNLPQMLSLAGIPGTQTNPQQHIHNSLQMFSNVVPARPQIMPQIAGGLTLNTGLTTVQVQKPRPIPSPIELPRNQVPIFRPRNPMAFMRHISPPVTPATGHIVQQPPIQTTTTTTVTAQQSTPGEPYNPEEPSIEVEESDVIKKDANDGQTTTSTEEIDSQEVATTASTEEDTRTQDELVQIAMGNVPLTPIVGSQPSSSMFPVNGTFNQAVMQQSEQQNSHNQQMQMFQNTYVPDLIRQTFLPMTMTNQQHFQQQQQQQLQFQQQQQQQAILMAQSQQPNLLEVPSKQPYQRKTVLEIRKIPAALNNIVKLSEHFQKFGTITKLQSPFENDPQGALIEFSSFNEARAAYQSPEAILGNRFIKMFWHNANKSQKNHTSPGSSETSSANDNAPPRVTQQEKQPKKIPSSEDLIYRNPKSDPKVAQLEKKKELEKLKMELKQKKQTHYDELLKKQKSIAEQLGAKNVSKDEKTRLLKAFKHCDAALQKLNKEMIQETKSKPQSQSVSPVKHFQDAKKEILDREIDIYHGNLEGEELMEAKKSLEMLKKETAFTSGRGRGYRGRGRATWKCKGRGRGRGRGGFQSSSVDNRPKQILVAGYDATEKDDVVAHFANFGHLDRIEETVNDKMILTFPTRKSAEIAAVQGAEFNGKQLVLTWFTGQSKASEPAEAQQIQRRVTRSLSQSIMDKDLDDELLELDKDEEELLLAGVEDDDDDEEDVEMVDRSWRR